MSKSNVNPNHYKVAGRERQGEDIVQERHKQKHARSLTRERFEGRATTAQPGRPGPSRSGALPKAAAKPTPKPTAKPTDTGRPGAKKRTAAKTGGAGQARNQRGNTPTLTAQVSQKRGKRSTAQKGASSRHEFGPIPATSPVAGAFGREPSARRRNPRRG